MTARATNPIVVASIVFSLCNAICQIALPFFEDEKHGSENQQKADDVIPFYFFFEIDDREDAKDQKRDDFLHGLQLRGGELITADAVGRDLKAVFGKRNQPAHQNYFPQAGLLVLEMAVPGDGHK